MKLGELRIDVGELAKPTKLPNGWLKVDAFIARTGIQVYRNRDGTERRELRTPDEVFKGDALASFALTPVTDQHPPQYLDANNTRQYARGAVGEAVVRDGSKVRASMLITDAELIGKMERGDARQVSCGYLVDLDMTPGVWEGLKYDAVQRNIRGNHVAMVPAGRAGPEVAARMDGAEIAVVRTEDAGDKPTTQETRDDTVKHAIKVAGMTFEVEDQALAQAVAKQDTEHAAKIAELERKATDAINAKDGLQAKLDSAQEDLKKKDSELKELPAKLATSAKARADLESRAKKVLGEKAKLDGLTDRAVQLKVIGKVMGDEAAKAAESKSDAYVEARSDAAFDSFDEDEKNEETGLARARGARSARGDAKPKAGGVDPDDDDDDHEDAEDGEEPELEERGDAETTDRAYEKMVKDNRSAWEKNFKANTRA